MKALALAIFMVLSASSYANTTANESVWFDGGVESDVVNLATEKTRTEYRTVTVPSTCYRTEYRHRCHWSPGHCRPVCDRNGNCRTHCSPGRQICNTVPVRIPYGCQRQVRESYQVFDYNVNTTVSFTYELENILNGAGEEFVVSVTGKEVGLELNDSEEYLVLKRQTESSSSREGDTLHQNLGYQFDFVPAQLVRDSLGRGVQNVSLNNGVLTFALGKSFNTDDFIQNLRIYKSRWLGRDSLLLDKDLQDGQMDISVDGDMKVITVDLKTLGINLPSRMRVIMSTTFDSKGAEVMNADSFDLETSANWVFSK